MPEPAKLRHFLVLTPLWSNQNVPLSSAQQEELRLAMESYCFPAAYFDYSLGAPLESASIRDVESRVKEALQSGSVDTVRDGLSNVLYWGYAQIGYRSNRIQRFRELVTVSMLESAAVLFKQRSPSVMDIMELKLPEFSGLSFVSKIRMFLDPERSAVLDKQILKMNKVAVGTVLSGLSGNGTSISITQKHAQAYEQWCQKLLDISIRYFEAKPRAVDVERGFFHLIQTERVEIAATLLRDA